LLLSISLSISGIEPFTSSKDDHFMSTEFPTTRRAPGYSPDTSTPELAKEQASSVAGSAGEAGQHVASVAKEQASQVAAETRDQARNVLGQARIELTQQASDQQERVVGGLRSLGTELGSMAERSEQPGVATDLARQASSKVHEVAEWLEGRDPSSLLDEMRTFARQRPGTFLALALGAGVAVGRVTRGLKDESSTSAGTGSSATISAPTVGSTEGSTPYPGDTTTAADPVFTENSAYAARAAAQADTDPFSEASAYPPVPADGDEIVIEKTTYTERDGR
jgi:hypothetical protein